MADKPQQLVLEDARMLWPNFAGKESTYNAKGVMNFCVVIADKAVVKAMAKEGWNIKHLKDQDDEGRPLIGDAYIQVKVSYDNRPPKVMLIAGENRKLLAETEVSALDYADILRVDMVISPYEWKVSGNEGIKGYLREMYVTIEQSDLSKKYEKYGANDESEAV